MGDAWDTEGWLDPVGMRGVGLPLADRDCVDVSPGEVDREGERLTEALVEGERVVRKGGEGLAGLVPAGDGDVDREMPGVLLGWGLLDPEGDTAPDTEGSGVGDTVWDPPPWPLEALGSGDWQAVALRGGEREGDNTVALGVVEAGGLLVGVVL